MKATIKKEFQGVLIHHHHRMMPVAWSMSEGVY